jgi:hypothetical protein
MRKYLVVLFLFVVSCKTPTAPEASEFSMTGNWIGTVLSDTAFVSITQKGDSVFGEGIWKAGPWTAPCSLNGKIGESFVIEIRVYMTYQTDYTQVTNDMTYQTDYTFSGYRVTNDHIQGTLVPIQGMLVPYFTMRFDRRKP